MTTEWFQYIVPLKARPRGCHVVTRELVSKLDALSDIECGLATFFIQHTSASLTINENASPDVPLDLNVCTRCEMLPLMLGLLVALVPF